MPASSVYMEGALTHDWPACQPNQLRLSSWHLVLFLTATWHKLYSGLWGVLFLILHSWQCTGKLLSPRLPLVFLKSSVQTPTSLSGWYSWNCAIGELHIPLQIHDTNGSQCLVLDGSFVFLNGRVIWQSFSNFSGPENTTLIQLQFPIFFRRCDLLCMRGSMTVWIVFPTWKRWARLAWQVSCAAAHLPLFYLSKRSFWACSPDIGISVLWICANESIHIVLLCRWVIGWKWALVLSSPPSVLICVCLDVLLCKTFAWKTLL